MKTSTKVVLGTIAGIYALNKYTSSKKNLHPNAKANGCLLCLCFFLSIFTIIALSIVIINFLAIPFTFAKNADDPWNVGFCMFLIIYTPIFATCTFVCFIFYRHRAIDYFISRGGFKDEKIGGWIWSYIACFIMSSIVGCVFAQKVSIIKINTIDYLFGIIAYTKTTTFNNLVVSYQNHYWLSPLYVTVLLLITLYFLHQEEKKHKGRLMAIYI